MLLITEQAIQETDKIKLEIKTLEDKLKGLFSSEIFESHIKELEETIKQFEKRMREIKMKTFE